MTKINIAIDHISLKDVALLMEMEKSMQSENVSSSEGVRVLFAIRLY